MRDTSLFLPSWGSMLTFGLRDPKAVPAVPTEDEQFLQAMQQRGVIRNEDSEEK